MNIELEYDKRISVLEKSMEWAQSSIQRIDQNMEIIKNGQILMMKKLLEFKNETIERFADLELKITERISSLQEKTEDRFSSFQIKTEERFSSLQAHTEERFTSLQLSTEARFTSLQAHTDERFTSLQAHTDERISSLQAHTDDRFIEVHKEITGIHRAISVQTKWIVSVILAAAAIASVLQPIMMKLVS